MRPTSAQGQRHRSSAMQGHMRMEARGWLLLSGLVAAWSGQSRGAERREDGECGGEEKLWGTSQAK
jgi:hypothetical protein